MSSKRAAPYIVLTSACKLPDRWLFRGRAMLYASHIVVKGWGRTGRYERRIQLSELASVGWYGGPGSTPNLFLNFSSGEVFSLRVQAAALWRLNIDHSLKKIQARQKQRPYVHRVLYEHIPAGDGGVYAPAVPSVVSGAGSSGDGLSGDGSPVSSPAVAR